MKNLSIYINPEGFIREYEAYAEMQIDNALRYWDKEDLLFVTNFPFEYRGVKSWQVPGEMYCKHNPLSSKINVVVHLLEQWLSDLTWYHDMEAWQIAPLDLQLEREVGLTDYGWRPNWNLGSFFFYPTSIDMFRRMRDMMNDTKMPDEWVLKRVAEHFPHRIQRLNVTYNFGKRKREENLERADKPIRVVHFHPYREKLLRKFKPIIPDYLYKMMEERQ